MLEGYAAHYPDLDPRMYLPRGGGNTERFGNTLISTLRLRIFEVMPILALVAGILIGRFVLP